MPAGPKGRYRAVPAVLLGHLELLQEQAGGQEPADAPVAAGVGREAGGGERRLRPAVVREAAPRFKTWAEEGPPKGTLYHYPNPHNHQILSIAAAAGAAQDRRADLHPGDHDQDDRAPHAGRGDGKDARLGRERGRRLHARPDASAAARNVAGAQRCAPADPQDRGRQGRTRATRRTCRGYAMRGRDGRRRPERRRYAAATERRKRTGLRKMMQRKSTIAFLMALPLILLIAAAGALSGVLFDASRDARTSRWSASSASATSLFLFKRETFWMVVQQSCIFAITAVIFKALIGFIVAHFVHNIPGQGPAQVARHAAGAVGDPAGDEHARLAVAVRSVLQRVQLAARAVRHRARSRGPATPTGRASR